MTAKRVRLGIVVALAGLFGMAGGLQAQDRNNKDKSSTKVDDKTFAMTAAKAGKMEVKMAQMAEQRSVSADVKKFALRMIEDHTKANKELAEIVGAQQDATQEVDKEHQEALDHLFKLQGVEFDREYAKIQLKAHEEAVQLFDTEARSGQDSRLKAFAAKCLPTLREHLQMAKSLASKVGAGAN